MIGVLLLLAFIATLIFLLLIDPGSAITNWINAKADEIRARTERIRKENSDD